MNNKSSQVSVLFLLFSVLFCVCLIASNVFETKQIAFFGHSQTGGVIVFPISYIINDVVCEVWGFRKARLLIWLGFLMNFFFVAVGAFCDWLPGADYWEGEEGFHYIFGLAPRIAAASFVAFLAGSFVNAYVMSKMKVRDAGKHSFVNAYVMSKMKVRDAGKHFSLRAILSTVFGEGVDSILFFPLALGGIVPTEELPWLMLAQVCLKTAYEIIVLPVTIRVVGWVKKHEQEDVYDNGEKYNVFKIFNV